MELLSAASKQEYPEAGFLNLILDLLSSYSWVIL